MQLSSLSRGGKKGKHEEAEWEITWCDDLTPSFSILARTLLFHFLLKLDKTSVRLLLPLAPLAQQERWKPWQISTYVSSLALLMGSFSNKMSKMQSQKNSAVACDFLWALGWVFLAHISNICFLTQQFFCVLQTPLMGNICYFSC